MSRHHVFTVFVFIIVLLALGGAYQFYFKEKLEAYAAAESEMKKLEGRLKTLHTTFKGTQPTVLLSTITSAVQPIEEKARQRSQFFHVRDLWVEETLPENSPTLPKFDYETRYREKFTALFRAAQEHRPPVQIPANIFDMFGVPTPAAVSEGAVNKQMVEQWLTQINFGSAIVKQLIDANAYMVREISIWPPRYEFNVLKMRSVGMSFVMRAEDLVKYIQGMQRDTGRYFSINGIRIQNRDLLASYGPPYLEVEMVLTVAEFDETKSGTVPPVTGGLTTASTGMGNLFASTTAGFGSANRPVNRPKQTFWTKLAKLWPF